MSSKLKTPEELEALSGRYLELARGVMALEHEMVKRSLGLPKLWTSPATETSTDLENKLKEAALLGAVCDAWGEATQELIVFAILCEESGVATDVLASLTDQAAAAASVQYPGLLGKVRGFGPGAGIPPNSQN